MRKKGGFKPLSVLRAYFGFVVANFDQSELYGFVEGIEEEVTEDSPMPYSVGHAEYIADVESYIEEIKSGRIEKAIYSRIKPVNGEPINLFEKLDQAYPDAFVYEVKSNVLGHWIGATPEYLVKQRGDEFSFVSLAGTKLKGDNSGWGQKEIHEQAIVTDYLAERIQETGLQVESKQGPKDHVAGPVKHLKTVFECVGNAEIDHLVRTLHPTPAVSGTPQDKAISFIKQKERHDRELYAGVVGVIDPQRTDLFVNLRCLKVVQGKPFLYVGGGITCDSDPEKEWIETENKAKTLEQFLKNS